MFHRRQKSPAEANRFKHNLQYKYFGFFRSRSVQAVVESRMAELRMAEHREVLILRLISSAILTVRSEQTH